MRLCPENCAKRTPGCHSTCGDYAIEKAFWEAAKKEQRDKYHIDEYLIQQVVNGNAAKAKHNQKRQKYKIHKHS